MICFISQINLCWTYVYSGLLHLVNRLSLLFLPGELI